MAIHVIDADAVRRLLPLANCVEVVRRAMQRLSAGETIQPLRQVIPLAKGRMFGVMPGAMGTSDTFGAKVLAVDQASRSPGKQSHRGGILLFDGETGDLVALVHAGAVTAIRTAAASAVATDLLARANARSVAILGYGEQAHAHAHAMNLVRAVSEVRIWGRAYSEAVAFANRLSNEGVAAEAFADVAQCVQGADIICATTAAQFPILFGEQVEAGSHINLVGSSVLGPREVDDALVMKARVFGDYRSGILAQGAEFCHARAQGLIEDEHFLGEIGQVQNGVTTGRLSPRDITMYKSLGHIVQDLASAEFVYRAAIAEGMTVIPF